MWGVNVYCNTCGQHLQGGSGPTADEATAMGQRVKEMHMADNDGHDVELWDPEGSDD